jgi:putative spermidine/putrescine transport system substrate-binding protein
VKRAIDKIKQIREHAVSWRNGTQAYDLFRNKDVVMGNMWHPTALDLRHDLGGAVTYGWDNAVVAPAVWIVPKHNPAGAKAAMAFFTRRMGDSPSNPATSRLIPHDLRADDPGQPANDSRQVKLDAAWYGEHRAEVEQLYLDAIS